MLECTEVPQVRHAYLLSIKLLINSILATCEASFTWSGHLPVRHQMGAIYSPKVFLGGVPWDITEAAFHITFKPYGLVRVDWPGKDSKAGYVYLLFESDKSIKSLLHNCTRDVTTNEWFFRLSSRRMRSKEVQVLIDPRHISRLLLPMHALMLFFRLFHGLYQIVTTCVYHQRGWTPIKLYLLAHFMAC